MERYPNKQKAIDLALWQNYNHRFKEEYGVVLSIEGDYMVIPCSHTSLTPKEFETLPKDYAEMTYKHISQIASDIDPLSHWEEIQGMFSVAHREILRFILNAKIPLEKFIRYELAKRGYDQNCEWIGFDKAEAYWLK